MSFDLSNEGPPLKRQKHEDDIVSNDDIITKYITEIMNSKKNLEVILPDEFTEPVPLTKAFVGNIKDVKNISSTMKILNENLPLKELSHLKRARGRSLLICHVNYASSWSSIQECMDYHVPGLVGLFEFFREVDVPAYMPKMKWQYLQVLKSWGCNFHPDNYLEGLSNIISTDSHRTFMAINFETIRWYCKKKEIDAKEDVLDSVNASVVVDPSIDSVVAVSFDNRLEHPVQHSAMIAIDNVARTQGGGSWDSNVSGSSNLSGIEDSLLKYLKECFPDVKFGAKEHFSKSNIDSDAEKDYSAPYLCTNYYIYMLREPCIMCSMGLTHARVKRVFFCKKNKSIGGLLSRAKLHTVPFLNHHFEVFTGFLPDSPPESIETVGNDDFKSLNPLVRSKSVIIHMDSKNGERVYL